ncbi:MAG: mannose-6-phosphate isomerase, class I [Treponematales bacterium]
MRKSQTVEIYELVNEVQRYDWGSPVWLPELLGEENPGGGSWAELWMGTHPNGPSKARVEGGEVPLAAVAGGGLPFLFKALAAAQPLSLSAHPDKAHAEEGWARENRAGIPAGSPQRNYRDDNHKHEILCALRPFTALCGFREAAEIREALALLESAAGSGTGALKPLVQALEEGPGKNPLRDFFLALMSRGRFALSDGEKAALGELVLRAEPLLAGKDAVWGRAFAACALLARRHPGDSGVLAPLYLNLLELKPGEAVYIPAGVLHSYLYGFAVELMTCSDNALRGGLTSKHTDSGELCRILNFAPSKPPVFEAPPEPPSGGVSFYTYPAPDSEFALSSLSARSASAPWPLSRAAIVLVTRGEAVFSCPQGKRKVLGRGQSAFLPAQPKEALAVSGDFTLYIASQGLG